MNDWFNQDELPVDQVTLEDFENLCDRVFDARAEVDEQNEVLKSKKQYLTGLELQVQAQLEALGKVSHQGRKGTIGLRHESYPSVPKDEANRHAFFDYLKKQGVYDQVITVNAQWLRGFAKHEYEAHADDPTFKIPGTEPFERTKITMRRKK